jgi:nitroreductase
MELFEAIRTRRSIRSYSDSPVPRELLVEIVSAAMQAPSAGNQQPWHFVIVTDKELLEKASTVHPHVKMAAEAPAAVLVCADLSLEKFPGYWVQDCAAATQNLLLAAHARGLGAVWTGIYPMQDRVEAFTRLLQTPATVVPLGLVVLGHREGMQPPAEDRYRPERIHWNGW